MTRRQLFKLLTGGVGVLVGSCITSKGVARSREDFIEALYSIDYCDPKLKTFVGTMYARRCPECKGSGLSWADTAAMYGYMILNNSRPCSKCEGRGWFLLKKEDLP